MNKKRIYWIAGGLALALVVGVVGKKQGWWGQTDEVLEVEVAKSELRQIVETVSASGRIQPAVEVKMSPEVSGEIIELAVVEGQSVRRGQLLARINPDLYQSAVGRAEALVNQAKSGLLQAKAQFVEVKAAYQRNQGLYDQNVLSKAEWEAAQRAYQVAELSVQSAEFQVRSAENSLKESRDNLKRTTLVAPMDGTVTGLNVELGERVVGTAQMAGTELMRISDLGRMEVVVDVNENDIVRINVGDSADVRVDAFLGHQFKAVVTEVRNAANVNAAAGVNQVTNFKVTLEVDPASYQDLVADYGVQPLRSGMTATVDVRTDVQRNVVSVPVESVALRSDSTSTEPKEVVFVVDGTRVRQVPVTTGIQDEQFIQVVKGLKDGESVVRGPFDAVSRKLEDGDEIKLSKGE
ncbi:MAG: efflux RND transporter periplasmic adaptor subunit [Schleiferiaceae bacterium]